MVWGTRSPPDPPPPAEQGQGVRLSDGDEREVGGCSREGAGSLVVSCWFGALDYAGLSLISSPLLGFLVADSCYQHEALTFYFECMSSGSLITSKCPRLKAILFQHSATNFLKSLKQDSALEHVLESCSFPLCFKNIHVV